MYIGSTFITKVKICFLSTKLAVGWFTEICLAKTVLFYVSMYVHPHEQAYPLKSRKKLNTLLVCLIRAALLTALLEHLVELKCLTASCGCSKCQHNSQF